MRFIYVISGAFRTFLISVVAVLVLSVSASGKVFPPDPAGTMLPDTVGGAHAAKGVIVRGLDRVDAFDQRELTSLAEREYVAVNGRRFIVTLATSNSDAQAYSRFTRIRALMASNGLTTAAVGTDAFYFSNADGNLLHFVKGSTNVSVKESGLHDVAPLLAFGRALAEKIHKGEGEVPVLVKHMPGWPSVQGQTNYFVTRDGVLEAFGNYRPLLDVLSFDGGADAAATNYDGARLLLIEFYTPQLATDNNNRIVAKINELKAQGQPASSAYRRVGNYAVFVFDAANEQAANHLIDQVQYEQLVQWLGKNPNVYDRAANEFTRTTLGVFIAVVKASGLALLLTLGIGGVVGAILFSIRRKQKQAFEAYSDAGGMLRLNIDDMTPRTDDVRLLGPGN